MAVSRLLLLLAAAAAVAAAAGTAAAAADRNRRAHCNALRADGMALPFPIATILAGAQLLCCAPHMPPAAAIAAVAYC